MLQSHIYGWNFARAANSNRASVATNSPIAARLRMRELKQLALVSFRENESLVREEFDRFFT
jgi:hypothetical protein